MTLSAVYQMFSDTIHLAGSYFIAPHKRVFIGFIISSLFLAYFVYKKEKQAHASFWKYVFQKNFWWGKSAFTDYGFFILNAFLKVAFLGPLFMMGLYVSFHVKEYLLTTFGYVDAHFNETVLVVAYTIALFLARDLIFFITHLALHKIPFLWRFHQVHHSATALNPMTQYRIHPVELLINNTGNILVVALVTGFFDFLYGGKLTFLTVVGVNVFNFIFLALGANLRHSHVRFSYPSWLEKWLISPAQHQIHHSSHPDHFDKNLGSALAIWDRWMNSLLLSKSVQKITFGLGNEGTKKLSNFWQNLLRPFT